MDELKEREGEELSPAEVSGGKRKRIVALAVVVVLAVGAGIYWFSTRHRVSTDNAYVKADSAAVSCRVSGTVSRVLVENDVPVEAGQVLLELDPRDYLAVVARAEAVLNEAEAEVKAADVVVSVTDARTSAQLVAAEAAYKAALQKERESRDRSREVERQRAALDAELAQAERDTVRYESLYKQGASSERQHEVTKTALKKARANVAATDARKSATDASAVGQEIVRASAQLDAARSDRQNVEVEKSRLDALMAKRDRAKAELETARLNLSYCVVRAPIAGYIAQKNVQVGDRLQPGQAVMAVTPLREVYVEANFKETQLTDVRLGQPAEIRADVYPGFEFTGKVAGIRAGTGASFALLPAENATGNWIKIVQRVPVRIVLDAPPPEDHPLRVGFSLDVTIDTRDRSGEMLVRPASTAPEESMPLPAERKLLPTERKPLPVESKPLPAEGGTAPRSTP